VEGLVEIEAFDVETVVREARLSRIEIFGSARGSILL
jgi:hypothetical protein